MAELVIKLVNGELAGKTVQQLTKDINAAALAAKKAEIGTQDWVDANKKLETAKNLMSDLKKQIDSTTAASNEMKGNVGEAAHEMGGGMETLKEKLKEIPIVKQFLDAKSAMQGATGGVGGLTSSFGTLKGAIMATGIGLLIVAVSTLVEWFAKTSEGAKIMKATLSAIEYVTTLIFGKLVAVGKALFDAFKNPRQALSELVDFIETNLMNRLKAFGVMMEALDLIMHRKFSEGAKKMQDAVIQLGTGVTDGTDKMVDFGKEIGKAAEEGYHFSEAQSALAGRTRELNVQQAQTEQIVSRLVLQSKNLSKTYDERIALLDQAASIEKKNFNDQLENARKREELAQEEFDRAKGLGILGKAEKDALAEAQIALVNMQKSSIDLEERIQNRRDALVEKQLAALEKIHQAELKRMQEEKDAQINIEDLKVANMQAGFDKEIATIKAETQKKISALKGSDQQIFEQEKLLLDQQQEKIDAATKARNKKVLDDKIKQAELDLATEQNLLNQSFVDKEITENQFRIQSGLNLVDFNQKKLAIIKNQFGAESAEYQKAYAEYLAVQEAATKTSVAITKAFSSDQAKAINGGLSVFGDAFGKLSGMFAQGTMEWKAFATSAAIISAIQGGINAYSSTAAIPIIGPELAPIAAGIAIAAGMAEVIKIQNTKMAPIGQTQFEHGGAVLSGPSHAGGGIPIVAEGGEIVLTKGVYRNSNLRAWASAINVAGGGRSFAAGGPVNPFDNSRGPMGRTQSASSDPFASFDRIEKALMAHIEATDRRFDRIRVENVATETEDVLKTVNRIRSEASV